MLAAPQPGAHPRQPVAAASAPKPHAAPAARVEASGAAAGEALIGSAAFTERTLADVRRRGWAQSAAEREPGVASVSAPVRDRDGVVIAAVSISGPIDRMGRRPGDRWAADLLAAAEALTQRL